MDSISFKVTITPVVSCQPAISKVQYPQLYLSVHHILSGVARVISLGGGGQKSEESEKKMGVRKWEKLWGKTGSEKNFGGPRPSERRKTLLFGRTS